jgi:flagellar biosynthesis/type III secretory pathway M-ring protein FliF/YscJ
VSILVALLALVLVLAVIFVISRPLRRARAPERSAVRRRRELEALRETKYREIRDAELDYRMGKLSSEDYELLAAELRVEALEILDRLRALADGPGDGGLRERD